MFRGDVCVTESTKGLRLRLLRNVKQQETSMPNTYMMPIFDLELGSLSMCLPVCFLSGFLQPPKDM